MKLAFGNIQDFRKECIDRFIQEVRRDYMVETRAAEISNVKFGKIGITRFLVILTATDGKDILEWKHCFFSCLSDSVEDSKKEIEDRTFKVEAQLSKDFPEEYTWEQDDGTYRHKFTLKKGVIEEL